MKKLINLLGVMLMAAHCYAASPLENEIFSEHDFNYAQSGSRLVFGDAMYGYANANTNISVSATEAGSNGPCISIGANGTIKYFTGSGSEQAAAGKFDADSWIDISMVVNKTGRTAALYVNKAFVANITPRSSTEELTMLSVFMSSKSQSLYFDDFKLLDGEVIPQESYDLPLSENFETAEAGDVINNVPNFKLRSNTGVTGTVGGENGNKFISVTKSASANAALLWDFSKYVENEDTFTVSYDVMLTADGYESAVVNISVSDAWAVSTGSCVNISGGAVNYFTGTDNNTRVALQDFAADEWINIKMVVYKTERRARLYVGGKYIDDIYPRSADTELNKLSIFLSTFSQTVRFDNFSLSAGVDIPETLDELIKSGSVVFTDGEGGEVDAVPYSGTLSAELTVNNPLAESKDIIACLAIYSDDGALMGVAVKKDTVAAERTTRTGVTLTREDMVGLSAKFYVWEGMKPLRDAAGLLATPFRIGDYE